MPLDWLWHFYFEADGIESVSLTPQDHEGVVYNVPLNTFYQIYDRQKSVMDAECRRPWSAGEQGSLARAVDMM